jgi:hypothetical protein
MSEAFDLVALVDVVSFWFVGGRRHHPGGASGADIRLVTYFVGVMTLDQGR